MGKAWVWGLVMVAVGCGCRCSCTADDRKAWAQRWFDAAQEPWGEAYNRALEQLTRGFSARGVDPSGPGGSALSQLRMNEAASGDIWELREWQLEAGTGGTVLRPSRSLRRPIPSLNGTAVLADFLLQNAERIRSRGLHPPAAPEGTQGPRLPAHAVLARGGADGGATHTCWDEVSTALL